MADKTTKSTGERIVRASIVVAIAHFLFKFIGLVQAKAVGHYLDRDVVDVVYVFAFEGVILTLFFIGEEVIGPCLLPVFAAEKERGGDRPAWALVNILLTVQTIILLLAIGALMCFPEHVIELITFWKQKGVNAEKFNLARTSIIWLAPMLFCLSLASTTYMVLNGYKKFFLAAMGDAAWKLCVVVSLVVGIAIFHWDVQALIFGLVIGSVAKLLTHLVGLARKLRFFRPSLALKNPAFRRMLLLMLPLIVGIIFAKWRDIFNNVTVLSSLEGTGILQANSFGRKLFQAINSMAPYAVAIAMFPFFCDLVDRGDRKRLGEILTTAVRMLLVFFVPGAILIAVLSDPLCIIIFRGGKFSLESAHWVAVSNACYILALPAYSLEAVIMQGYFANRKMISATIIGMVFSMLSMALSYLFVISIGVTGTHALMAVALGYSLSRTLKTVTLACVLKRTVPMLPVRETCAFLAKVVSIGIGVGVVGVTVMAGFELFISASNDLVVVMAKFITASLAGAAMFIAGTLAAGVGEPMMMIRWGLEKWRRRGDQ